MTNLSDLNNKIMKNTTIDKLKLRMKKIDIDPKLHKKLEKEYYIDFSLEWNNSTRSVHNKLKRIT